MDYNEQVAALEAAAAQDTTDSQARDSALLSSLNQPAPNDAAPETPEPVQPGTTEPSDSDFDHGVDINSLPDEAREYALRAERMMKAAMTKRTQEAAPWRKLGEEHGVSPDEAAQALAMWRALDSDPTYGKQLYNALGEGLRSQGILEDRPQQREPQYGDAGFGQQDEWAEDPYATQIDALNRRLEQFELTERDRAQAQWEMDQTLKMQRQEFTLRQQHQDLTDQDMQDIYDMAVTTNGDLDAAHQRVQYIRDQAIQSWVSKNRANAQSQPVQVPPGAYAEAPPTPPSDMKSGSEMARQIWAQYMATRE